MADRKTYAIRLLPEVMKAIRILAIEKEMALSHVIEEAISDYLKKNNVAIKRPHNK